MNNTEHSTGRPTTPAAKSKPADQDIASAVRNLDCEVTSLRQAALVLDEYTCYEIRSAHDTRPNAPFPYTLTIEQVEGIRYMLMHVRDLAWDLEKSFDKAFGRGVQS
ncbi:hypothetical protein G6L05_02770 [Agrobacterium rhizogenes]|nr:hypothetical protein [Rhizobium rhizogenes]